MAVCSSRFGISMFCSNNSMNDTGSVTQRLNQNSIFEFRAFNFLRNVNAPNSLNSTALRHSFGKDRVFIIKCISSDISDNGAGGDGSGNGDGDWEVSDGDELEFGPLMKFEDVIREAETRWATLPSDILDATKTTGIRRLILTRYLYLQVVIDSCCATFAEVQKRGKDFWAEFELNAADLLVGVIVDIALVGMLAPYVRIGKPSVSSGLFGHVQHFSRALPTVFLKLRVRGVNFQYSNGLLLTSTRVCSMAQWDLGVD